MQGDDALPGRSLGEDEADGSLVGGGGAVGGVVHLEDEVGAGGDELGHGGGPLVGRAAGSVDEKQVAGGLVGLTALDGVGERGGGEGLADGGMTQPG